MFLRCPPGTISSSRRRWKAASLNSPAGSSLFSTARLRRTPTRWRIPCGRGRGYRKLARAAISPRDIYATCTAAHAHSKCRETSNTERERESARARERGERERERERERETMERRERERARDWGWGPLHTSYTRGVFGCGRVLLWVYAQPPPAPFRSCVFCFVSGSVVLFG